LSFLITHLSQPKKCANKLRKSAEFLGKSEMGRNKAQFQKGLSEVAFEAQCGTEVQCRAAVVGWALARELLNRAEDSA
jgi:hypothetical protein